MNSRTARRPYRAAPRPTYQAPVNTTPTAPFAPSPFQAAIFDWVETGNGSALVIAVAGSGKTKTIEESAKRIAEDKHVLMISFGKEIARELQARIEKLRHDTGRAFANLRASTVHSLGFIALIKKLGRNVKVTDSKLPGLMRENFGERDCELYSSFACQLVKYARGEGIGAIAPDTDESWFRLVYHHDIMLESDQADEKRGVEIARKLLQHSIRAAAENGLLDFDDQLYLPLLWNLRFWQNDFVMIDEAQDTNPVRRAIAKRCLKIGGRLIAFGDPSQSIFGFTGASVDALDLIRAEFNAREFPLSVCYRCSRAVVEQAKQIVPHIEAAPGAPEGKVAELPIGELRATMTAQDAILCRNTAPLVALAYALIARGTGCRIAGKEIGEGLVKLIRAQKTDDLAALDSKLTAFVERETAKFIARGEEHKADALADKTACIRAVADALPADSNVDSLCAAIGKLFDDRASGLLTLSTIHKAKGKEWPAVAVLSPELSPSKYARQAWQQQQETNLIYVRDTRAMQNLYMIAGNPEEMPA